MTGVVGQGRIFGWAVVVEKPRRKECGAHCPKALRRRLKNKRHSLSLEARRIAVLLSSEGLARGQAVPAMPRPAKAKPQQQQSRMPQCQPCLGPGSEARKQIKQDGDGEPMQSKRTSPFKSLCRPCPSLPLSLALPPLCCIRIRSPLPKVTAHRHSRSRELCACDQCPELCQAEQPLVAHPKQISRITWWARRVFAPGAFCTNASGGLSWHHRKAALLGTPFWSISE